MVKLGNNEDKSIYLMLRDATNKQDEVLYLILSEFIPRVLMREGA